MKRIVALITFLLMLTSISVYAKRPEPGNFPPPPGRERMDKKPKKEKKQKKTKQTENQYAKVYMFGVSASFSDSIVYVTNVQEVDSAYFILNKYLGGYKEYSDQMAAYFTEKTGDRRTNSVFFKRKRKDIEKQYVKLRKKYTKNGINIQPLPTGDFVFKPVVQE